MAQRSRTDFARLVAMFQDTDLAYSERIRTRLDAIARRVQDLLGAAPDCGDAPAPPTALTATADDFRVDLAWTTEAEAVRYRVYRSLERTTAYTLVGLTTDGSYMDTGLTADVEYFYYLLSEDECGQLSGQSEVVSATPTDGSSGGDPPGVPTGLAVDAFDENSVDLSWDNPTGGTVSFNLERSLETGTGFVEVASSIVSTNIVDAGLLEGTTYYYRLRGVNAAGTTSTPSSEVSVTTDTTDIVPPPVPTLTGVNALDESCECEWSGVAAADLAGYEVGYHTVSAGPYTYVNAALLTSVTVGGLTNDTEYFFVVRSYDESGNRSADSNEIAATPTDSGTGDPPEPPTNVGVTSPVLNEVKITWDYNFTEPALANFNLYRTDNPRGGVYVLVTDALGTAAREYTDTGLDSTTTYYYYLTAEDTSAQESDPSVLSDGIVPEGFSPNGSGEPIGDQGDVQPQGIDGDTGLPSGYRAPGYTFDHVVDLTNYTGETHAMQVAGAVLRSQVADGTIELAEDGSSVIGVCLPARTERRGAGFTFVSGKFVGTNVSACHIPHEQNYELHFIAPWTGGADKTAAMRSVSGIADDLTLSTPLDPSNFQYRIVGADETTGESLNPGSVFGFLGGNTDVRNVGWAGDIHCWGMRFAGGGSQCLEAGWSAQGEAGQSLNFHLCRFDGDDVSYPLTGRGQKWGMSTYDLLLSFHGCYVDFPWSWEHAIYQRDTPWGDESREYLRIYRCGGQAIQQTLRGNDGNPGSGNQFPEPNPGTTTYDHFVSQYSSRAKFRNAASLTRYGPNQDLLIRDSLILQDLYVNGYFDVTGENAWPPPDPFADPLGDGSWVGTEGILTISWPNPNQQPTFYDDEGFCGGDVTIQDSFFYTIAPGRPMIQIGIAKNVDVQDSGIWTGPIGVPHTRASAGSQSRIQFTTTTGTNGTLYAPVGFEPEFVIQSINWTGNNTGALKTQFNSITGIDTSAFVDPSFRFLNLAPGVDQGTADQTLTCTNVPYLPGSGLPADLSVS